MLCRICTNPSAASEDQQVQGKGLILEPGEDTGVPYLIREAAHPARLCSSRGVPCFPQD